MRLTPIRRAIGTPALVTSGNLTPGMPTHDIGDVLAAWIAIPATDSISSVSGASGWAKLGHITAPSGTRGELWWKQATTYTEATPTFVRASSAAPASARIISYRGAKNASPVDVYGGWASASASTLADGLAMQPTVDDALVVTCFACPTAAGGQASFSGYTNAFSEVADYCTASGSAVNQAAAIAEKTLGAKAPEGTDASISSSQQSVSFTFILAPQTPVSGATWYGIPYVDDGDPRHVFDVLLPTSGFVGRNPGAVIYHGGGGDRYLDPVGAQIELLKFGIVVIAAEFNNINGTTVVADDVNAEMRALTRFIRAHGAAFGIDVNKLGGWGASFGASFLLGMITSPDCAAAQPKMIGGDREYSDALLVGLSWFGESHPAVIDAQFAALGITRSPQLPACTVGSPEYQNLGNVSPCTLPRFDGSPAEVGENLYNVHCAQYWPTRPPWRTPPKISLAHGDLDSAIPWLQSWNDQSGAGATSPTGMYQKLVAAGVPTRWVKHTGAPHGGNAWLPSSNASATAGNLIDAEIAWLAGELWALGAAPVLASPRMMRSGLAYLSDRDIADFGLILKEAPGLPVARDLEWPNTQAADSATSLTIKRDPILGVRVIELQVTCTAGDSQETMLAALERAEYWCSLGPMELRTKHDPTMVYLVRWLSAHLGVPVRQFNRSVAVGTLRFACLTPWPFHRWSEAHVTNGAGAANRVAVPCGSAPARPDFLITNATNPTVIQRRHDSSVIRQSTYLVTLGSTDALYVSNGLTRIVKYVGGVATEDASLLTLGDGYFTLHQSAQQWEESAYQTFEISSGNLTVITRRARLR